MPICRSCSPDKSKSGPAKPPTGPAVVLDTGAAIKFLDNDAAARYAASHPGSTLILAD